jgi:hypothetical protein
VANTSSPERQALWRDRVNRQPVSGLTVAQFCARERCALAAFHAWKRRFRLTDAADHCPTLPAPSAFLPVTVRALGRRCDDPPPIEADLPNGIRLRIPTADAQLACRVVRAVVGSRTGSGGSR